VAAASRHSLALVDGGSVYSFGAGDGGRLGHGDTRCQWAPKRIQALAGESVAAVAAGESHGLCALRDGRVFGWGSGGAVGLGDRLGDYPAMRFGSAGNYENAPGDGLLSKQAHSPLPLHFPPSLPE